MEIDPNELWKQPPNFDGAWVPPENPNKSAMPTALWIQEIRYVYNSKGFRDNWVGLCRNKFHMNPEQAELTREIVSRHIAWLATWVSNDPIIMKHFCETSFEVREMWHRMYELCKGHSNGKEIRRMYGDFGRESGIHDNSENLEQLVQSFRNLITENGSSRLTKDWLELIQFVKQGKHWRYFAEDWTVPKGPVATPAEDFTFPSPYINVPGEGLCPFYFSLHPQIVWERNEQVWRKAKITVLIGEKTISVPLAVNIVLSYL